MVTKYTIFVGLTRLIFSNNSCPWCAALNRILETLLSSNVHKHTLGGITAHRKTLSLLRKDKSLITTILITFPTACKSESTILSSVEYGILKYLVRHKILDPKVILLIDEPPSQMQERLPNLYLLSREFIDAAGYLIFPPPFCLPPLLASLKE